MKTYLRNELIIPKGSYINQVFKIIKGHITNQRKTKVYYPKDYLFLDQIYYNSYTLDDYYALDLVVGEWIDKSDIGLEYLSILSKMYQEKNNQTELLLLHDPIIKVARYFWFEYQNKKIESFYLEMSIKDLSYYLNLSRKELIETIQFLESSRIISHHNKLYNLLDIKKLENRAYFPDH